MKNTAYIMAAALLQVGCAATGSNGFNPSIHYSDSAMIVSRPQQLVWNDLGLVPGVKIATLHGDPAKAGHYVLRLKFPANSRMPAHWHPRVELATIISGTLLMGMGAQEDPAGLKIYEPGSFLVMPPRMVHYGKVQDEVIIELSGPDPYEVVFVNPADDPRKR